MSRAAAILGMLLVVGLVEAQPPVLTLEDCIAIGLQRSGRLQNAVRDEQIAEVSIEQVRSQIYPHLEAHAGYTRMDELESADFGDQSMRLGSLDNYSAGLTLKQLLYSGGAVRAGLRAAEDYRHMMYLRTAETRSGLIRDIRAGFVDLLLLAAVIRVHEQTVAQLRDVVVVTARRFRQDQASELDVLNARVGLANAVPDLIRASNDWSVARAAFGNLIHIDDAEFSIAGELQYEPFETAEQVLLEKALSHRPEIMILERRMALQRADVRVEQGAYRPALHLTAGYSGQDPAGMISSDAGWDWRWTVGAQARWNWFDGGLRRRRIRQKRLEYEQSIEQADLMKRLINQEVRQARLRVDHAAAALTAAAETVTLSEKTVGIANTRYELGLITRLEYTDISLASARARLNRLRALRDHERALNDLRHAVGEYACMESVPSARPEFRDSSTVSGQEKDQP